MLARLSREGEGAWRGFILWCLCEKMAIMETAISASLSHPNIVQVGRPCQ
jgi:hypothetical protein